MIDQIVQRQRNQSLVFSFDCLKCPHSISFTCTSLTIHKQRSMVTSQNIVQKWTAGLFEYRLLGGILIEYSIKIKLYNFFLKIECDSMINQLQRSFGKFIAQWSVTHIDFNLARIFLLVNFFRSTHRKYKISRKQIYFINVNTLYDNSFNLQKSSILYYLLPAMRPSNQYSNTKSSQIQQSLNTIAKNKKQIQSDFRVHFTLMNIKWRIKDAEKQQKLIEYIYMALNSICWVHMAQISAVIDDDTFDVSIGFCNDYQAFRYLRKKNKIMLNDGIKQQYEVEPIISRSFQRYPIRYDSYMSKNEKEYVEKDYELQQNYNKNTNQNQLYPRQSKQEIYSEQRQNRYQANQDSSHRRQQVEAQQSINSKYLISNCKQRYYESKRDHRDKEQVVSKDVNKVLAFGIPKQFTSAEVKESILLQYPNIQILETKWKNKQHMQYLQIELSRSLERSFIYDLSPQIDQYPYIIVPQVSEHQINKQLSKYTVQIISRPGIQEQEKLIKQMKNMNGINIMIRTPIKDKDQYRYIIVFNNVVKAEKACQVLKQQFSFVFRKQYQLRVGRVNKFFTFKALIQDSFFI